MIILENGPLNRSEGSKTPFDGESESVLGMGFVLLAIGVGLALFLWLGVPTAIWNVFAAIAGLFMAFLGFIGSIFTVLMWIVAFVLIVIGGAMIADSAFGWSKKKQA